MEKSLNELTVDNFTCSEFTDEKLFSLAIETGIKMGVIYLELDVNYPESRWYAYVNYSSKITPFKCGVQEVSPSRAIAGAIIISYIFDKIELSCRI